MNKQTICPSLRTLAAALLLAAWPVAAQTATPSPSGGPQMTGRRGGAPPCLQKAGINRSVMEQVHAIQSESHSQIASVCENSSLTPQQKQEQIRQIREQTKQKIDSLITPQQQEALRACRQETGMHHAGMAGGGGGGPCGELHPNRPSGTNNNPSGNSTPPNHD
jgi:TolA-binding protein